MELILSAISAGGLTGAANQYACLLIISIAARLNIITLSSQTAFFESYWFIGIVALFWVITLAPAYSTFLAPGVGNVINTISNFLSGFIVPLSSALLSLAAIGVIVSLNPQLDTILKTLKLVNNVGNFGPTGYFIATAGAVSATALTGVRALAKPVIAASTGTTGTISAPLYATLENLSSIIVMVLTYFLAKVNPWFIVTFFAIILLLAVLLLVYAINQLKRLRKGFGRVLQLAQSNPKAGLSIVVEFFVWGLGWLVWKYWARGVIMLVFLSFWLIIFLLVQPLFVSLFAFIPPAIPFIAFFSVAALLILFVLIGLSSSKALLSEFEKTHPISDLPTE